MKNLSGGTSKGEWVYDSYEPLEGRVVEYTPPLAIGLLVADYHCRGVANPVLDDD
ncbi:hypothetical protein [Bacillus sp. PK3_68]|uniref:hypothetical protein n=1 Tax=Bacillus sp. PK3_68 TaxID=2027408 RepID=UPI0016007C35|nr:hypothetical protein [Bacillus sp. PK3_68]